MVVRLRFIEAMLLTKQRLTRQIISDTFGISLPSATRDIKRYRELVTVAAVGKGGSSTYELQSEPIFQWLEPPEVWLHHLEKIHDNTTKDLSILTGG